MIASDSSPSRGSSSGATTRSSSPAARLSSSSRGSRTRSREREPRCARAQILARAQGSARRPRSARRRCAARRRGRPRTRRDRRAPSRGAPRSRRRGRAADDPASVSSTARIPGRARHERHADDPLERPQLLADRRLRVAEPHGGAAHRTLARDRLERGEVAQIEPGPFRKSADDSRSYPEFARARPGAEKVCAHAHSRHPARRGQGARAVHAAAREASLELDIQFAGPRRDRPLRARRRDRAARRREPRRCDGCGHRDARGAARGAAAGLPMLGICLGAELLAEAAGGVTGALPARVGVPRGVARPRPPARTICSATCPSAVRRLPGARLRLRAAAGRGRPGALAGRRAGLPRRIETRGACSSTPSRRSRCSTAGRARSATSMAANGVDPEVTRRLGRRYVPEWSEHAAAMGRRFAAWPSRPDGSAMRRGAASRAIASRSSCSRCWSMIRSTPASR